MATNTLPALKVLHLVSAAPKRHDQHSNQAQLALSSLLPPLLSRVDRTLFNMQVVYFAPGDRQAALMRQQGIPVHEVELSRNRFAVSALSQLQQRVASFQPDLIHAWGHSAQLLARYAQRRLRHKAPILWSQPGQLQNDTLIDRLKLKWLTKRSQHVQHIIYPSQAAAAVYQRAGFADQHSLVINSGIDTNRYKPDAKLGQQLRSQLKLEANAFVIGMHAPFAPEYDFHSFIRATAELIKYHPDVYVLLAGKGVQRGNSGLMGMLGGGSLATRTTLLGEFSDLSALFNACDVVCSSALNGGGAQTLAAAMLCGIPVVATGKGLQGEVLGKFGIAVEPGSPNGLVRGIAKLRDMPAERRMYLIDAARQHIVNDFSIQGAVQQYLSLYMSSAHAVEAATAEKALKLQQAITRSQAPQN